MTAVTAVVVVVVSRANVYELLKRDSRAQMTIHTVWADGVYTMLL